MLPGLASGLALAVRPAGSAEVSGAQGRGPEDPFCEAVRNKGSSGALDAGGADPDNARRSGPVAVTLSHGDRRTRRVRDGPALLVWRGIGGVTAGTGCGRCRGSRARQFVAP